MATGQKRKSSLLSTSKDTDSFTDLNVSDHVLTFCLSSLPYSLCVPSVLSRVLPPVLDVRVPGSIENGSSTDIVGAKSQSKPRGKAFVDCTADQVKALMEWDGKNVEGRTIRVQKGKDKDEFEKEKILAKVSEDALTGQKKKARTISTVVVKNLAYGVTQIDLEKLMEEAGRVREVRIPLNERGKGRGFAFVDFDKEEEAKIAVMFDGTTLMGRKIEVTFVDEGIQKESEVSPPPVREVFVRNLSLNCTKEILSQFFSSCGNVVKVSIPKISSLILSAFVFCN